MKPEENILEEVIRIQPNRVILVDGSQKENSGIEIYDKEYNFQVEP